MAQNYPFTKSRYFKKKRLRAADFERDQAYVENKIALLSQMAFGKGIALGLGVQRIDSDSILVEHGLAVDGLGRFLVVDEPAVCRVRTLPGFDSLTGETALLWLSYQEELFDPMFVSDGEDEATEYAGIKERFSFQLTDMQYVPPAAAEQLLFFETVLFEDDELRVKQIIPRMLSSNWKTELKLVIENYCVESLELDISYAPVIPGFTGEDGNEPCLARHICAEKGVTVLPLAIVPIMVGQSVVLSLPKSGFSLRKHGVSTTASEIFQQTCRVVPENPAVELEPQLTERPMQELLGEDAQGVPIAAIRFVRYQDNFLLDDVVPVSERIAVPYLKECLRRFEACFTPVQTESDPDCPAQPVYPEPGTPEKPLVERTRMTTGTLTLNTGMYKKAGDVLQSDEIAHGLGPGTVFVEFGIENVYPAVNMDQNRTDLLLGDVSLFEQAGGTYNHTFDRGVRVHPDKGTFEVAVRLCGELRRSSLRLRWFAWRSNEQAERPGHAGTLLRLAPDVISVEPGAVVDFVPVFSGGAASPCDFFVEGKHAGIVTRDGVYTAPEKPGLYQVTAQTRGRPEECAHGFVIVKEAEDGPDSV